METDTKFIDNPAWWHFEPRESVPFAEDIPEPVMVPTTHLLRDPDSLQWRTDEAGDTLLARNPSEDKFEMSKCPPLAVWRNPEDECDYVADGMERHERAERDGIPELPVMWIQADSAEHAREIGRQLNQRPQEFSEGQPGTNPPFPGAVYNPQDHHYHKPDSEASHPSSRPSSNEPHQTIPKNQAEWESSLTPAQKQGISTWIDNIKNVRAFRKLAAGEQLPPRSKERPSGFTPEQIEMYSREFANFKSAIDSAPPFGGQVFRAMHSVPKDSFKEGAEFVQESYASTARKADTAGDYYESHDAYDNKQIVMLDLRLKTGADIGKSGAREEDTDEVLIRPKTRFKVLKTEPFTFQRGKETLHGVRVIAEEL